MHRCRWRFGGAFTAQATSHWVGSRPSAAHATFNTVWRQIRSAARRDRVGTARPACRPDSLPQLIEANDHQLVLCGSASRTCAADSWASACRSGRHSRSRHCTPQAAGIKKGVDWTSGRDPSAATSSTRRSDAGSTAVNVDDLARHVVAGLSQETDGFRDVFRRAGTLQRDPSHQGFAVVIVVGFRKHGDAG